MRLSDERIAGITQMLSRAPNNRNGWAFNYKQDVRLLLAEREQLVAIAEAGLVLAGCRAIERATLREEFMEFYDAWESNDAD